MERREALIAAFALRYLADNLDDDVEETLNDTLNDAEQVSLISAQELEEMAEGLGG